MSEVPFVWDQALKSPTQPVHPKPLNPHHPSPHRSNSLTRNRLLQGISIKLCLGPYGGPQGVTMNDLVYRGTSLIRKSAPQVYPVSGDGAKSDP